MGNKKVNGEARETSMTDKCIIDNKSASFDYFVEKEFEAGLVLEGNEVKKILSHEANLKGAYCSFENETELYITNFHINTKEPLRKRKLLLNKKELKKLYKNVKENGYTIIPLFISKPTNKIKCTIGLCKGKKQYDKRAVAKENEIKRNLERKDFDA